MKYIAEIEHEINDTPCIIGVIYFDKIKGSYDDNDDSDLDYYGYVECDWDILDENGVIQHEIKKNLSPYEIIKIDELVEHYFLDTPLNF